MKPKPTMNAEEEAAWNAHISGSKPVDKQQAIPKRRRAWTLEELWEQQSIFASQGLRDTAEFLLWLEKK